MVIGHVVLLICIDLLQVLKASHASSSSNSIDLLGILRESASSSNSTDLLGILPKPLQDQLAVEPAVERPQPSGPSRVYWRDENGTRHRTKQLGKPLSRDEVCTRARTGKLSVHQGTMMSLPGYAFDVFFFCCFIVHF